MKNIFLTSACDCRLAVLLLALFGLPAACAPPGPEIAGCPIFPPDHIWNTPIAALPREARSDDYVRSIGAARSLHPDPSIPFVVVPPHQKLVKVVNEAEVEGEPGPYPIPPGAPIEGGPNHTGDRHVLVLQSGVCLLHEFYRAFPQADGSWRVSGAVRFDLRSYVLRPSGWSSVDAAGLPILPGLLRYEEVASGNIAHALRFTAEKTRGSWVWPGRHRVGVSTDPTLPPMGQRFRLRASYDLSGFPRDARVILEALKKYGLLLSDIGGPWFITGVPDPRWNTAVLETIKRIRGSDMEAVDTSSLILHPDSGRARR